MSDLPAPIVPAEIDLRDFAFTPIFRGRLFGSSFHARASDGGWRAGVTLWLKSWDQSPAGTLPDDEIDLCRLAELGRDLKTWRKISKEALHGWFKCSDGRLYHKVVAEGVLEAWQRKKAQRDRTEKARHARLLQRQLQSGFPSVTDNDTECVTESKGQGQGIEGSVSLTRNGREAASGEESKPKVFLDPDADLFRRARELFGDNIGGQVSLLKKSYGGDIIQTREALEYAATRSDGREYLAGIIKRLKPKKQASPFMDERGYAITA